MSCGDLDGVCAVGHAPHESYRALFFLFLTLLIFGLIRISQFFWFWSLQLAKWRVTLYLLTLLTVASRAVSFSSSYFQDTFFFCSVGGMTVYIIATAALYTLFYLFILSCFGGLGSTAATPKLLRRKMILTRLFKLYELAWLLFLIVAIVLMLTSEVTSAAMMTVYELYMVPISIIPSAVSVYQLLILYSKWLMLKRTLPSYEKRPLYILAVASIVFVLCFSIRALFNVFFAFCVISSSFLPTFNPIYYGIVEALPVLTFLILAPRLDKKKPREDVSYVTM